MACQLPEWTSNAWKSGLMLRCPSPAQTRRNHLGRSAAAVAVQALNSRLRVLSVSLAWRSLPIVNCQYGSWLLARSPSGPRCHRTRRLVHRRLGLPEAHARCFKLVPVRTARANQDTAEAGCRMILLVMARVTSRTNKVANCTDRDLSNQNFPTTKRRPEEWT